MNASVDILKETKSREIRYLMEKEISFDPLKGIIAEISEAKRKIFIRALKMPINTQLKKIPIPVLLKHVRSAMLKDNGKLMILTAVKLIIHDVYDEIDVDEIETLMEHEAEIIDKYGRWHYYWALQLMQEQNDRSEIRLKELEAGPYGKLSIDEVDIQPEIAITSETSAEKVGLLKKLAVLERRVESEQKQRMERETTITTLKKQLLEARSKTGETAEEMTLLHKQVAEAAVKESQLLSKLEIESANRVKLEQERSDKNEQIQKLKLEIDQLKVGQETAVQRNKQLKQAHVDKQEEVTDMVELGKLFVASLHKRVTDISSSLSDQRAMYSQGSQLRKDMRSLLDMADTVDAFIFDRREQNLERNVAIRPTVEASAKQASAANTYTARAESATAATVVDNSAVLSVGSSEVKTVASSAPARDNQTNVLPRMTGIFQRRDHGGYIMLDNGTQMNIPEHMVTEYSLVHEAEVRCTMNKLNHQLIQHIEVLLQGDESRSPVRQYMGYVELGDHFNWYCIDIQDANNRFVLHHKDVQMRQLNSGDVCLFNIEEGKTIARLSRLYNDASLTERKKITAKTSSTNSLRKEKVKPYLEGCTVAVVGGLHKWFESVVEETGATYIHETGDNPDRIAADLKRANVLFLLITATSHRATWACTEIAKQHNIPQFIIQGSKSNLRSLLWDNRAIIQSD